MSFETLKTLINDKIKSGLPTGIRPEEEHNPVLQSIVNTFGQDYIYMGLATTSTSPSTDDNARMYITNGGGTYTNFLDDASSPIVVESGSVCFLKGVSGTYSKDVIMDGESILDNTKLRINDNGSTLDLEAYHNSAWVSIGKFSYDGTEATYESLTSDSVSSDYLSASSIVSDSITSDTMTLNGAAPVSLKGLAGGMSITKQRQEQVGGDKIVNTAANSIAELSDAGVLGKAALVYAPFTSRVDYTDSLVPSHDYGRFDFARSSSKYVVNKDGLLIEVLADVPSYEYDNGAEPYLLTEPASTNLLTYPISFSDSYWTKTGASVVSGFDAPKSDGSGGYEAEAFKLVEDTSNGSHVIRKTNNLTITSGVDIAFSIYAKKGERNWIAFSNNYGSGLSAWFDLENGVWGQVNGVTVNSEVLANGWYRLSLTAASSGTSAEIRIYPTTSDGNFSYQGDGTSGLYIAYAQLEEQASATSLMLPAVEGSTSSRVADTVTNGGSQALFSGVNASGVLYAEIAALANDLTSRTISISDGTTDNRVNLNLVNRTNEVEMVVFVGGSLQTAISYVVNDETEFQKVAVRYAQDDFSLWIDGIERSTDISGITFPANTLNGCRFDRGTASQLFYGKTKGVAVFNYLSDTEMNKLTTV